MHKCYFVPGSFCCCYSLGKVTQTQVSQLALLPLLQRAAPLLTPRLFLLRA